MNPLRKAAVGAALIGATITGGAVGATFLGGTANAQTGTTSSTTVAPDTGSSAPATHDPSMGGHTANGITEALLTGDTAAKVTAAAQAAVPDGTIERVENDAEGSPYEAHVVKADGTHVTVKVGSDFTVTSIDDSAR